MAKERSTDQSSGNGKRPNRKINPLVIAVLAAACLLAAILIMLVSVQDADDDLDPAVATVANRAQGETQKMEDDDLADNEVIDDADGNEGEEVNDNNPSQDVSGVSWLTKPELTDSLNAFNDADGSATYYKVGDTEEGGKIVAAQFQSMGISTYRFLVTADGSISLLANHSSFIEEVDSASELGYPFSNATFAIDRDTIFSELQAPEKMTVNDQPLVLFEPPFIFPGFYDVQNDSGFSLATTTTGTVTEVETNDHGVVYEYTYPLGVTEDDAEVYMAKRYYLKLADSSLETYTTVKNFFADDNSVVADWNSAGASFENKTFFKEFIVREGCGGITADQLISANDAKDLIMVGSTLSEGDLYTIRNAENRVLKSAYKTYAMGRLDEAMTYEEFVSKDPLLVWKSQSGDYVAFLDNSYAPLVECGKPVIYLYPDKTTRIDVHVGADVTLSEPEYNNGWEVVAKPNGVLHLAGGQIAPNLYWEGTGYGEYPKITTGRVVAAENIAQELRSDLLAQGLVGREVEDFMEFWLPRMPETPYIRLSWFTTEQMNQLAPLRVVPQPKTVKRVFLDFSGQDSADTNLLPQQLTSFSRDGYTLVEWGGLLVGGHE